MTQASPRRRRGKARRTAAQGLAQLNRKQMRFLTPPTEPLGPESIERIHEASLQILEEIGINFLLPEAKALLKQAGLDVSDDHDRIRLDRGFIEEALASAPSQYTLYARNPENNIVLGGDYCAFGAVASPPNVSDIERGRRTGNHEDFRNLVKLTQYFNILNFHSGYPVEPIDLPVATRHLDSLKDIIQLSDKPFNCYSLGTERNLDAIEMARIARGISHEQLLQEPSLFTIINANSPLTLDNPMLEGIIEMAKARQVMVLTPFTLSGAMAPVTLIGALAQQNAEALAGIAFAQTVNPGTPCMYGGFTSNVDMKSGAPAFGTPEYLQSVQISGQLARRYGLPYRSSNVNAANFPDAQAAYESMFSLWGITSGHCNLLMHGAGWLEGGLCTSYEKFVMDCDLLQMVRQSQEPLEVDDDSLALEAIRDVGPGGHFFGTAHTQARYETAFYAPILSDWRNFETWQEAGEPKTHEKAHKVYKQILADFEAPALDPAINEELEDFVARRKAAL